MKIALLIAVLIILIIILVILIIAMHQDHKLTLRKSNILTGEDAKRFIDNMNKNRTHSPEEQARINANYQRLCDMRKNK